MGEHWDPVDHPRNPANGQFVEVGVPGVGGWIAKIAGRLTRRWENDQHARDELTRMAAPDYEMPPGTYMSEEGGETAELVRFNQPDGRTVIRKRFVDEDYPEEDDDEWDSDEPILVDATEGPTLARAEVRSARVAELIRAPVPPVVADPNHPGTVWMGFVDGRPGTWNYGMSSLDTSTPRGQDAWRLGLLDLMIANSDRSGLNWMITPGRRFVGIDHGGAEVFTEGGLAPPRTPQDMWLSSPFARIYFEAADGHQLKPNLLHPDDIRTVRERVTRLAAEKDDHGMPMLAADELAYMVRVLDLLEPHAQGTRRLIL